MDSDLAANTRMNSPFRYAGGKFYARNLILEYVTDHSLYVEPFAGGASIFFAKNKTANNWLNDADPELVNCYITIRDQSDDLIKSLASEEASKERHTFYKNEFKPKNKIESALRWYYLNRTSYSGIMNMKNCFWGYGDKYSMRPENWPRNIQRTSAKLQGVKITNYDFKQVLDEVDDNAFLFIDPPYFNADQDKFYEYSFIKDDHFGLAKILKDHSRRLKFIVTYDDCPEIRELYSWATEIHDKAWNYTLNRTDDQRKNAKQKQGTRYKGRELFILNYLSGSAKRETSESALIGEIE